MYQILLLYDSVYLYFIFYKCNLQYDLCIQLLKGRQHRNVLQL